MNPLPLAARTAFVTGASRGIGRAIALQLARSGAHVIVHYGQAATQAQSLVAEIQALGVQSTAISADLAVHGQVEQLFQQLDTELNRINGTPRFDILVNNAGLARFTPFDQLTEADFDLQFNVNVKAPTFIMQQSLPRLNAGGRIINVSSVVSRGNFFAETAGPYAATKGALDVLTRYIAEVAAPRGITVNSVNPGVILTDMAAFARSDEGAQQAIAGQLIKRLGQPEDVARIVDFLAGPGAAWITGQHLDASGGTRL